MRSSTKKRDTVDSDRFFREDELPQSLKEVIQDEHLYVEFMVYLKGKLAEETLLFHTAIERFEMLCDRQRRNDEGIRIVNKYVREGSEYWVNLAASTRTDLCSKTEFEIESFSVAKTEVYLLMSSNFFDSFKKKLMGEIVQSNKKSSSLTAFTIVLGKMNKGELEIEDCGCGNVNCPTRRKLFQEQLAKEARQTSFSSTMLNRLMTSRTSFTESVQNNPTRKRTQNAFRRIFLRKKSTESETFEE